MQISSRVHLIKILRIADCLDKTLKGGKQETMGMQGNEEREVEVLSPV